ncbi:sialidase family protein [Paenibacillus rhizoplanae]
MPLFRPWPQMVPVVWGTSSTITDINTFTDAGPDARGIRPGTFGAEYARMIKLANGDWLAVTAIYDNNGYTKVSWGGTRLQVFRSTDNCRTWSLMSTLWEDGRDLDNGQFVQLTNGDILLAMRSVRWQESYKLRVYKKRERRRELELPQHHRREQWRSRRAWESRQRRVRAAYAAPE